MEEIWKDIDEFGPKYQISNFGRIKTAKGMIRKTQIRKDNYEIVGLFKDGKYYLKYVHILVANAFLKKSFADQIEVNHIDGNKHNNIVSNLEWVSKSENTYHAIHSGLRTINPIANKKGKLCPLSKTILQYDLKGNFIEKWIGIAEAARFYKIRESCISDCIHGRKKTACGYIWREYSSESIPQKIDVN